MNRQIIACPRAAVTTERVHRTHVPRGEGERAQGRVRGEEGGARSEERLGVVLFARGVPYVPDPERREQRWVAATEGKSGAASRTHANETRAYSFDFSTKTCTRTRARAHDPSWCMPSRIRMRIALSLDTPSIPHPSPRPTARAQLLVEHASPAQQPTDTCGQRGRRAPDNTASASRTQQPRCSHAGGACVLGTSCGASVTVEKK